MTTDSADEIAAALARLRPRRPGMPGEGDPRGGWGGPGMHGHHHHPHPGMRGAPPWMGGGGRFGGPARLRLLDALAAASGPLSVSEAAEAIGVDQPRASRLVQQAVEQGLVQREADPDDARRTRIALTETGAAILGRFRGERRDAVRTALDGFTAAERTELARLLAKLAAAWPGA